MSEIRLRTFTVGNARLFVSSSVFLVQPLKEIFGVNPVSRLFVSPSVFWQNGNSLRSSSKMSPMDSLLRVQSHESLNSPKIAKFIQKISIYVLVFKGQEPIYTITHHSFCTFPTKGQFYTKHQRMRNDYVTFQTLTFIFYQSTFFQKFDNISEFIQTSPNYCWILFSIPLWEQFTVPDSVKLYGFLREDLPSFWEKIFRSY